MLAGPRKGVGEDQPTFGVRIADLDGQALATLQHVSRPESVAGDGVLDRCDKHDEAHIEARLHDQSRQRERMGRAAHVLLHVAHARRRLDVEPAGIERHPLADQGDQRPVRLVQIPANLDDPGRAMRGGGATDGVNGRIVFFQQVIAGDDRDRRAVGLGDLAGDGLHLQRAHVGGRGIDHLPGQGAGRGDAQGLGDIQPVRRDQPHLGPVPGPVPIEDVATEEEGQGRDAGVLGFGLQPINS